MKIATWNVNSVRARKERLLDWLEASRTDVVCLQETKVEDEQFPTEELAKIGYSAVLRGQSAYNGVAILAREGLELEEPERSFEDGNPDEQARLIAATCAGIRVVCVYVPNGQSLGSDKFNYKIDWLGRLRRYLDRYESNTELVLCGDFNVAPDERDVHDPSRWEGEILCSEAERKALKRVVDWGLTDAYRLHHKEGGHFSWWDYRMQGFRRNHGLRIDHLYVSAALVPRCVGASIDREERGKRGPSDHAPVVIELK